MPQVTGVNAEHGMWELVDQYHTCVYPPGDPGPPDPSLVKEIRVFCPEFVPVLRIEQYVTPTGGVVTYGFHGIGMWQPESDPTREPPLVLDRGEDFPFIGGVVYMQQVWGVPPNKEGRAAGMPCLYLPFNRQLVEWMNREHYEVVRSQDDFRILRRKQLQAHLDREQKAIKDAEDNARLQLIDDRHQISKAINAGKIFDPPREAQTYVDQKVGVEVEVADESA